MAAVQNPPQKRVAPLESRAGSTAKKIRLDNASLNPGKGLRKKRFAEADGDDDDDEEEEEEEDETDNEDEDEGVEEATDVEESRSGHMHGTKEIIILDWH
jgi:hypothetical protein